MRHPEGQARRSLETCDLEWDLEEDQEVSGLAEERGTGGRSRARSKGLNCGKELGEEELLGGPGAGWGAATSRVRRGWGAAGAGPPGEQGGADRDGAVGLGNPRRLGLSSSMAEARLCPFEPLL